MKKNLQNALLLAMGLMTTVTFAQDWDVDSRTRVNMHGEDGMMLTEQRATIGATWGGSDWGIHVSSDVNYAFGNWGVVNTSAGVLSAKVYEAYASTDLMGYANLTAGRQALDYGSGAIISSNQFGTRTTWDGLTLDLGLDIADITLGYASMNYGFADVADGGLGETKGTDMYINVNKADGDWSANLLYGQSTATIGGVDSDDASAMGIDLAYALMGGDLNIAASYNTNTGDEYDAANKLMAEDMLSIGATYNVNEDMTVTANRTTYGENGFDIDGTNMAGGWLDGGNMGYLGADDQDLNIGATYSMGDFNLGATIHMITNTGDDVAGSTVNADYERNVTDISLAYNMSDNASLSIQYATDEVGDADADKYMWVTLNIRP
jgi:hypothetical protein